MFSNATKYILIGGFVFLICSMSAGAQTLKHATGGSGAYKGSIWWLDFTGVSIAAGETKTIQYNINGIALTVVVNNVRFSGQTVNGPDLTPVRLVGYRSGGWRGDGLDDLYNIGGTGTLNTLYNALSTNVTGRYTLYPEGPGLTANFTLSAYATLNGQPLTLGMVFASAEADANYPVTGTTVSSEYSQGTTNGTAWQLLEKWVPNNGIRRITFSNDNLTARMQMASENELNGLPSSVALLYTTKQLTNSANPLVSNMQFLGHGKSAQALGIIINQDYGDAPASYGSANNVFFSSLGGGVNPGTPNPSNTVYLSSGTNGGTPVINAGVLTNPGIPRLGSVGGDSDGPNLGNAAANGDDVDGLDDEDAFPSGMAPINLLQASYAVAVPVFKNTNPANIANYITGWVDFNRDGIFSASERVVASFTANNTLSNISLSPWNLTTMAKNAGPSFARFRISPTAPSTLADDAASPMDELSFLALADGETEDYPVLLQANNLISGKVFHDAKGGTIDGVAPPSGLKVVLVNDQGSVVNFTDLLPDGSYSFSHIANGVYTLRLTNTTSITIGNPAPAASLFPGWANTAEGRGTTGDAIPNGIQEVTISNATPVSNLNFGIEMTPETYPRIYSVTGGPVPTSLQPAPLEGSDPEDQPARATWSNKPFVIDSLPTNGFILSYQGQDILVAGTAFSGYDPSLLSVRPGPTTPGGTNTTTFYYSVVDAAAIKDPSPAAYTINYSLSLPVVFGEMEAIIKDAKLFINWKTLSETNNDHYVFEVSTDGTHFKRLADRVSSKSPGGNSNEPILYSHVVSLDQAYGLLLSMPVLAAGFLLLVFLGMRNRKPFLAILLIGLGAGVFSGSCNKKEAEVALSSKAPIFLRIIQVDKDGALNYSKVIQAINQD